VYTKTLDRRELRELRLDADGRRAEAPATEFLHHLGSVASPKFSPDGRWLIFFSSGSLWIATADGGDPRSLASLSGGSGLHVSPDSRHVAFHTNSA
jgi:Tol biopolymer transport system component